MAKTLSFDMDNFKAGLALLDDDSMAPMGSARNMENIYITDRGGIGPRPGILMLGDREVTNDRGRGFFVFKKSFGATEIPMRADGSRLEVYTPQHGWFLLKNSFTFDKEFGFVSNLVNTDNEDFVYFCNRFEPFQRWTGQIANITSALAGGETTIPVDATLEEDIFYEGVVDAAPAPTTTSFGDDSAIDPWVADQWINFYVYITSGAQSGQVRKITAVTTDTLTFDALPGAPAAGDTFEIRMTKFRLEFGSTFIYNGTEIEVTDIPSYTELTVASAHAAPVDTGITQAPQEFLDAPRGNRIDTLLGRTVVGRVRSGMSRDAGGALQGSNSAGSVWVSRLNDPKDFTYDATRIAGQGDLLSTPYGGGDITDIAVQEEVVYIYKESYIEAVQYSQDINDFAVRTPLKPGAGSINKVIKGHDDHFFMTVDKQFTSLGRVENKDITVQTMNIGLPIRRLLQQYEFNQFNGFEYRNRILFSARSGVQTDNNDVTVVWNKRTQTFEGVWNIAAHQFDEYGDKLYFQEANGPNVWQMFQERKADVDNTDELPIAAVWQSNFFNLLPIKGNYQTVQSLAFEGYISANTTFTISLFKDFEELPTIEFDFGGVDDEAFLTGSQLASFLGSNPLGLVPIGTLGGIGLDGRRRFSFMVYFPFQYGQYFSLGLQSSGIDQDWEMIRASLGLSQTISTIRPGIKSISNV